MTTKPIHTVVLVAALAALAVVTHSAQAQQYYVRGSFNNWGNTPYAGGVLMNDNFDGTYSLTISGAAYSLTNGAPVQFKVLENDTYNPSWPGSNCGTFIGTDGNLTIHFRPGTINDGWSPAANRVGYDDTQVHDWEVFGNFSGSYASVTNLTDTGNGIHTVNLLVTNVPGIYQFKFRRPTSFTESIGSDFGNAAGNISVTTTQANQVLALTLDLPKGRWVIGAPSVTPTNQVTFLVDMQVPITLFDLDFNDPEGFDTNSDSVYVRGDFNGWPATPGTEYQLVQAGATLFSNTVDVIANPGTTINYKFFGSPFPVPNEERPVLTCNANRTLVITNNSITAPLAYWGDRTTNDPNVTITFSVDMSLQVASGNFTNGLNTVTLRGNFNNWGETAMAPNPDPDTNIYSTVLDLPFYPLGASCSTEYKFYSSAPSLGWESPLSTGGNNRTFNIASTNQLLPTVFWNDLSPCDLLENETQVTFSIDMTGAQGTDGTPYTGAETIYLNGEFLGWWGWGAPGPTNYALTKVGATDVHTITLPVVAGDSLALNYKYSIGGADNEAGQQTNHVRYIRPAAGVTNYTLPQDVWINSNPGVPRVEPEIGGLVARPFAPGSVTLDWSGLPCTWMQGSTNVAGPWTPLFEARGVASTNMTLVGEQMFFRLAR